jgi:hypothetical protein
MEMNELNMKLRTILVAAACACALSVAACGNKPSNNNAGASTLQPVVNKTAGPLPDAAFKSQITLPGVTAKLRAGQKETVQVHIRNASEVFWWSRGGELNERTDNKFYIAAGNRWLKADGSLVTDMDGRYGISKDLKPGEETEIPLVVTAPKAPGEYMLEVDLVQEGVSWFSEKGSPTARTKITVVK